MPDPNRSPDLVQYGRPLRKRYRPQPGGAPGTGAPAVGPVDADLPPDSAATIIRARPTEGVGAPDHSTALGAPPARRERRVPREPDANDAKLSDLVVFMAKGLVDHPDDVAV